MRQLKLRISPEEIDNESPLFGDQGLGLDSIDVLEVVASVEKEFGVSIGTRDVGEKALRSVKTLADFLVESGYRA